MFDRDPTYVLWGTLNCSEYEAIINNSEMDSIFSRRFQKFRIKILTKKDSFNQIFSGLDVELNRQIQPQIYHKYPEKSE